jgi:hypothetical protein
LATAISVSCTLLACAAIGIKKKMAINGVRIQIILGYKIAVLFWQFVHPVG